jgi:hypothetical protein
MAAMSRLAPLIVRRPPPVRAAAFAAPAPAPTPRSGALSAPSAAWLDDLRLFATGWIGGLIFFGILLG